MMPKRSFVDLTESSLDEDVQPARINRPCVLDKQHANKRLKTTSNSVKRIDQLATGFLSPSPESHFSLQTDATIDRSESSISSTPTADGSRNSPGHLLDDDDDYDGGNESDLRKIVQTAYPLLSGREPVYPSRLVDSFQSIDLSDNDHVSARRVQDSDQSHQYDALTSTIPIIDLEADRESNTEPSVSRGLVQTLRIGKVTCAPGKAIEFTDGTFMRITAVTVRDSDHEAVVHGKLFIRLNAFREKVPKRRNELVWVGDACKEGRKANLVRNRHLIMTNRSHPELSTRNHAASWPDRNQDVSFGPLFCRLKRTTSNSGNRLEHESWQFLDESEVDPGIESCISQRAKRFAYRKRATIPGGSYADDRPVVYIDQDTIEYEPISQQYTFGDAFCGAGGTSCGAELAGLRLEWSFDYDPAAVATYRLNFPVAQCHELPVHEFIDRAKSNYDNHRVDILHISPPCQPFSPAHTVPSARRDEMNQAALFSVGELIESVKPRIVTVEETEGLVSRHGEWFAALIHIFIRIGYSVSWKIIRCGDYGIPQPTRRRLIIVAAGPGEILPEFPTITHALYPTSTLKKIPTIGDLINRLEGYPDHDTSNLRKQPQPPFSPDTYAFTLTCNSGVGNYHPSGLRNYTVRELACLQTFPRRFKFADVGLTAQRRQIGNAVPPQLARAWMKTIIRSLRRSDELAN